MKSNNYGFEISNHTREGFVRYFNSETTVLSSNKEGKLPFDLNMIMIAQNPMQYIHACLYCHHVARERGFYFHIITEGEYKKLGSPVSEFFKRIFKRNNNENGDRK